MTTVPPPSTTHGAPHMSPEAHQVWLGRSGVGDGSQDPPLCGSAAGRLVLQLVSLGTRAGPEVSGIWVRLIGHPLHHRGPSPSWDIWAVILKGPSRRSSESTRAKYGILGDKLEACAGVRGWSLPALPLLRPGRARQHGQSCARRQLGMMLAGMAVPGIQAVMRAPGAHRGIS